MHHPERGLHRAERLRARRHPGPGEGASAITRTMTRHRPRRGGWQDGPVEARAGRPGRRRRCGSCGGVEQGRSGRTARCRPANTGSVSHRERVTVDSDPPSAPRRRRPRRTPAADLAARPCPPSISFAARGCRPGHRAHRRHHRPRRTAHGAITRPISSATTAPRSDLRPCRRRLGEQQAQHAHLGLPVPHLLFVEAGGRR